MQHQQMQHLLKKAAIFFARFYFAVFRELTPKFYLQYTVIKYVTVIVYQQCRVLQV
jgi:hypothetical protein